MPKSWQGDIVLLDKGKNNKLRWKTKAKFFFKRIFEKIPLAKQEFILKK